MAFNLVMRFFYHLFLDSFAPSDAFGDPIFMDITALEPEAEFTSVFLSIKR